MISDTPLVRATLVFPSSTQDGLDFYARSLTRGERIIAASSLRCDETARYYENWYFLPPIHDDSFLGCCRELIVREGVSSIYCPVTVVHEYLKKLISDKLLRVELIGKAPLRARSEHFAKLQKRVAEEYGFTIALSESCAVISEQELLALFRYSSTIYGEMDDVKIAAFAGIISSIPAGDIVEIGGLMGKSAFVLAFLAKAHGTGHVLVVDPWDRIHSLQQASPTVVQNLTNSLDWELVYQEFLINLIPVARDQLNYLRMSSRQAFEFYLDQRDVRSPEFGVTRFRGEISLLHIDGNHDFDHAEFDFRVWSQKLLTGGWVVFDDYLWAHGDGPKRVGDKLLKSEATRIVRSFVSGKSLFIQFGNKCDL